MKDSEELLKGGNVADRVVRIGATVRKPVTPASTNVEALLTHLQKQGFAASPRQLGRDEQGRQILEYIPGVVGSAHSMDLSELERVGDIVRRLHDLSASFLPGGSGGWDVVITPDQETLICHNDLAPWNLVRDGERWVFIDWDGAGPGSRLWDLSYAAVTFLPIEPGGDPHADKSRLAALLHGYGLSSNDRQAIPRMMARRARAMFSLLAESSHTGRQPWARLYSEGHASYWDAAARYLDRCLATLMA